jgi:hypothetical protein
LLYCFCDKHFWVITQKTLKRWFVWPFTMRMEMARDESYKTFLSPALMLLVGAATVRITTLFKVCWGWRGNQRPYF